MPSLSLEIIIEDKRWKKIPRLQANLLKAAAVIPDYLPKNLRFPGKMTLLLTSDTKMRSLNRQFRGIDKATNVLSFPQFEPDQLPKMGKKWGMVQMGDIALGYLYIVDEANKTHKILINHCIHLMIHGVLHLLGYDHMFGAAAHRMERLERRIMAGLELPDPYAPQPREPKAR